MSASGGIRRCLLAVLIGLSACFQDKGDDGDLAGTSVGTGNPGKIKVSFKKDGLPFAFTGRIDLYGSTQIPITGFNPEPLTQFKVEDMTYFTLTAEKLTSIPESSWPRYSVVGDSLFRFNLIISEDSIGAILSGLVFKKKGSKFLVAENNSMIPSQQLFEIVAPLITMKPLRVWMRPQALDTTRFNFLFVQGTGYRATADSGLFRFPSIPEQAYFLSFISLPDKKRPNTSREDTADIYTTLPSVSQEPVDTLTDFIFIEGHPMPEQYRP